MSEAAPATDKAPAPAAPVPPAGTPAPQGAAPTTPAIDLNAVLEENRRLRGQYSEVRKFATQKAQRAAELERQLAAREADPDLSLETAAPRRSPSEDDRLAAIESDQAEIKFKQNTPDWNEVVDKQTGRTVWDEMNTILFDDAQAAELAGRTPYLTLRNIHREVQYRRLVAAQKAAAVAAPSADEQRRALRARAAMSGQAAGEGQEIVDVDSLTPEQMIEQGLVDFDPHNPPEHARKMFSKL